MPTSTSTSGGVQDIIFVDVVPAGPGLIGISNSPSLRAEIRGLRYQEGEESLQAIVHGRDTKSTNTFTSSDGTTIYVNTVPLGPGVYTAPSPDLSANYSTSLVQSGSGDIRLTIRPIQQGSGTLTAWYRTAQSGTPLDLQATLSGFTFLDLPGYIRPIQSGSATLPASIEPIPPVDLNAQLVGVSIVELNAELEAVGPEDLPADIHAIQYLDLKANIKGVETSDIGATYSGYYKQDLSSQIRGINSGYLDLTAFIKGAYGVNQIQDLPAFIRSATSGTSNISGSILGVSFRDLTSAVSTKYTGDPSDLSATVTGIDKDVLIGIISPTGSNLDLTAFLRASKAENKTLQASISGHGLSDLSATFDIYPSDSLSGTIIPSGPYNRNELNAMIATSDSSTLGAEYDAKRAAFLSGQITPIPGADLNAVLTPKVFYIDSTIPINTFKFENLVAIINPFQCAQSSDFSDLGVIISGTLPNDLQATLIGVAGQYAIAADELEIFVKNSVISEDWVFLIADQPAFTEDQVSIIITNSPLADLGATIEGVSETATLGAEVSSVYFGSVSRASLPVGQWLNTKTGETKIIKLFFKGTADTFYYSPEAGTTYSENPADSLEVVIETYKQVTGTGLLSQKIGVKQYSINNLSDFASIDEAIKFAIMCSVSELSTNLSAKITAVGAAAEVKSSISPIPSNKFKDLKAGIIPVDNLPDINATVSGSGDISDLTATIYSQFSALAASPFYDILGQRYMPTLVVSESGEKSVVLTPIQPADIITVTSPDLTVSVDGIALDDLPATVSGS